MFNAVNFTNDDDAAVIRPIQSSYTNLCMLIYYLYCDNLHAPFDTDEADHTGLQRLMDTNEAMDDAGTPTSTPTTITCKEKYWRHLDSCLEKGSTGGVGASRLVRLYEDYLNEVLATEDSEV
ncbi:hypothetical protein U9M48_025416 [Paspalum notatum var. saurae]|uniref:Uncharacterized protein n=1 Tax=Paspalum notatum var. saurae TaxID=547442 RepID=A0AAQ3WX31_PASNO